MVRASMAAEIARAAQDSAEGSGELEQTRAENATLIARLHAQQSQLHNVEKEKEELAEQVNELLGLHNEVCEQRPKELEALRTELDRLGLQLELIPPQKPKKKPKKKEKKIPQYQLLLEGHFKINLR